MRHCAVRVTLWKRLRDNLPDEHQRDRLTALSEPLERLEVGGSTLPRGILLPEKDVPTMVAAIAARATHLLTADVRHFGPYFGKRIQAIEIALPEDRVRMPATKN